jgi:hypothetical protein
MPMRRSVTNSRPSCAATLKKPLLKAATRATGGSRGGACVESGATVMRGPTGSAAVIEQAAVALDVLRGRHATTRHSSVLKGAGVTSTCCASMAEWTGLEPATPGVTGRYSNQLNYHSW